MYHNGTKIYSVVRKRPPIAQFGCEDPSESSGELEREDSGESGGELEREDERSIILGPL